MSSGGSGKVEKTNEEEVNDMVAAAFLVWIRQHPKITYHEIGKTFVKFKFGKRLYVIETKSKPL